MNRPHNENHEPDMQGAADEIIAAFIRLRRESTLVDTEDLRGAAIFVLDEGHITDTSGSQDKRSRRARERRQKKKRIRDFDIFLKEFQEAFKKGDISSQLEAVTYIVDFFSKAQTLAARRVNSLEEIRAYLISCFQRGDNHVEYWLGKFDTWVLSGQYMD